VNPCCAARPARAVTARAGPSSPRARVTSARSTIPRVLSVSRQRPSRRRRRASAHRHAGQPVMDELREPRAVRPLGESRSVERRPGRIAQSIIASRSAIGRWLACRLASQDGRTCSDGFWLMKSAADSDSTCRRRGLEDLASRCVAHRRRPTLKRFGIRPVDEVSPAALLSPEERLVPVL